jgi:hypothetical protein
VNFARNIHSISSQSSQNIQPNKEEKASDKASQVSSAAAKIPRTKESSVQTQTQSQSKSKKDNNPSKTKPKSENDSANSSITIFKGCGRKGHNKDKCVQSKHPDFNSTKDTWKESKKGKAWAEHTISSHDVLPFKQQLSSEELPQEHLDEIDKLYIEPPLCFHCSNLSKHEYNYSNLEYLVPVDLQIHETVIHSNMLIDTGSLQANYLNPIKTSLLTSLGARTARNEVVVCSGICGMCSESTKIIDLEVKFFNQCNNNYESLHITSQIANINYDLIIGLPTIEKYNLFIKNHKHFKMNLSLYFSNYEKACLDITHNSKSLLVNNDIRISSSLPLSPNNGDDVRISPLLSSRGNIHDNITSIESSSDNIV